MNNLMRYAMLRESDNTQNRSRDSQGREHYDNGRYAPMRSEYQNNGGYSQRMEYGGGSSNEYRSEYQGRYPTDYRSGERYENGNDSPRMGNYSNSYEPQRQYNGERNQDGMRMVYGFAPDYESHYRYPEQGNEMEHRRGSMDRGHSDTEAVPPMDKERAERWMKSLKNEDGTTGPHWQLEEIKELMRRQGIQADPVRMWVAMNAEYSDRAIILRKYGLDKPEMYMELALSAWLHDRDAVPNKESAYYTYVVKH